MHKVNKKGIFKIENMLILVSIIMAAGFIIRLCTDIYLIKSGLRKPPLAPLILEHVVDYLLPGVACLIAGVVIKKRNNK